MMNNFSFYFNQGITHILDLNGYDHLLFVIALCALYSVKDWKKVLILLTAFTLGHSITLILSGLDILRIPPKIIETLIPVTIFLTALGNIILQKRLKNRKVNYNYWLALFFGLIHGSGFSNFFRAMMMGIEEDIIVPLLAFNLGIEAGQIIIVVIFFTLYGLLNHLFSFKHHYWNFSISLLAMGMSVLMFF